MTPREFRSAMERLHLNQVEAARFFGVSARQIRRYLTGDAKPPNSVHALCVVMQDTGATVAYAERLMRRK